jgi:hyaluronan synthase
MPIFILLMTAIALLVGICRYLVGAALRISHPDVGITKDYSYVPTVSILLPCFNEGEAVYSTIHSISESEYPFLETIVTDDCSVDDSAEWIRKAAKDFPNVVAAFNEVNIGKTQTILNALARSKSEVVIIVDSDTVLGKTCVKELMACLGDKRLGAVGAPAIVRNPNDSALTAFETFIYYLGFQLGKVPENAMRMVGVIGGYAFAIRRELFEKIRPDLEARNWFGVKVKDGEDRFISHLVLLNGYGTYMDMSALCWTSVPNTFEKYWKQQLRWRRTTIRDFFFSLRNVNRHVHQLGVGSLFIYILTPLILFTSIIQIGMMISSPADWLDPVRMGIFLIYNLIVLGLVKLFSPTQSVKNPLIVMGYCTWWIVNSLLLAPLATLTLDAGDWGNREKKQ